MTQAMYDTVDEVGRVIVAEGIDAQFEKAGTLIFATSPGQLGRVRGEVEEDRSWGFGEEDIRWLGPEEAEQLMRVPGSLGAAYTPHCACLLYTSDAADALLSVDLGARR